MLAVVAPTGAVVVLTGAVVAPTGAVVVLTGAGAVVEAGAVVVNGLPLSAAVAASAAGIVVAEASEALSPSGGVASAWISSSTWAGGEPSQTDGGHMSTSGSEDDTSYTPPRSVNRLSGYIEYTGAGWICSVLASMAGTARSVVDATVVALLKTCDFAPSRAKFG